MYLTKLKFYVMPSYIHGKTNRPTGDQTEASYFCFFLVLQLWRLAPEPHTCPQALFQILLHFRKHSGYIWIISLHLVPQLSTGSPVTWSCLVALCPGQWQNLTHHKSSTLTVCFICENTTLVQGNKVELTSSAYPITFHAVLNMFRPIQCLPCSAQAQLVITAASAADWALQNENKQCKHWRH